MRTCDRHPWNIKKANPISITLSEWIDGKGGQSVGDPCTLDLCPNCLKELVAFLNKFKEQLPQAGPA